MTEALALGGYVVGALGLGLWWGERGRARQALQLYQMLASSRGVPETKAEPAVMQTYPDPEAAAARALETKLYDTLYERYTGMGVANDEAKAEATRMVAQLRSGQ